MLSCHDLSYITAAWISDAVLLLCRVLAATALAAATALDTKTALVEKRMTAAVAIDYGDVVDRGAGSGERKEGRGGGVGRDRVRHGCTAFFK